MNVKVAKTAFLCLLVFVVGIGTYAVLLTLRRPPPNKKGGGPRTLTAVPLRKEDVVPLVREFAVVSSLENVELKAQVAGKVVFCGRGTEDGALVRKGELLARIDGTDYEVAVEQAEAELAILKSDAKRAETDIKDLVSMTAEMKGDYELEKDNYERAKMLFEKQVFAKSEYERAAQSVSRRKKIYIETANALSKRKFDLEATRARIKRAEAAIREAKANLDRASVRSPIDGRVDKCDIEVGEYLSVGKVICHVVNDSKPMLDVPVNADDALSILGVRPDKEHWLKIPGSVKAVARWLRNPGVCSWDLEVVGVEDYDRTTDTLKIRVVPSKYNGNAPKSFPLLPGMFCEVVFSGAPLKGVFNIPFSALQFGNNVFTIGGDGVLHRHAVKPFHVEGDRVIVLSGLPEGESVVVQQLPRGLVAGMNVHAAIAGEKSGGADGVPGNE